MLPLFHDFEDKKVLIVGGGTVALRKARRFADEANVTVLAPTFDDEFRRTDCELSERRIVRRDVLPELEDAYLVVPATDDGELNSAVETLAERRGCLVNRVDEIGDVVVPSLIESEEISVAISTGGSSPAMSKYLRRRVTPIVRRADSMVRLQRELRRELKDTVDSQQRRKELLWQVIESDRVREQLPEAFDEAKATARELVTTDD